MKQSILKNIPIIPDLSENIKKIKEISGESSDVLINEVEISGLKACLSAVRDLFPPPRLPNSFFTL